MTNKIAIVFGASGFLGSHVAEALSVDDIRCVYLIDLHRFISGMIKK